MPEYCVRAELVVYIDAIDARSARNAINQGLQFGNDVQCNPVVTNDYYLHDWQDEEMETYEEDGEAEEVGWFVEDDYNT